MAPATAPFAIPRCVFVTGPGGPGRIRWLEERLAQLRGVRCAVLLADEGLVRTKRFASVAPEVTVRCLFMPCLCCPGVSDLPRVARRLADESRAEWLFIEVPVLAAGGLLAEFDAVNAWPREVMVGLNREWARARRTRTLSVFQQRLLALADQVIEPAASPAEPVETAAAVPTVSYS
jgi:hypothetical protein